MKRRTFLKAVAGVTLAFGGTYFIVPSFAEAAENVIRVATRNLNIDQKVIDAFIESANKEKYWQNFSRMKKEFFRTASLLENGVGFVPYSGKYLQYKNQIVGQFLLSTDFFINKMDSRKKIQYVSFYNPYKMPCANPFSSSYYPA